MLNSRQYTIEFGSSMVLYTLSVVFSSYYLRTHDEFAWRIWVSLLPVIPAILATIAVVRAINQLDELQQRIQLMSFAVSFAIVGLSTFTYGFLERIGFTHISSLWVFPFMIAVWGISTPIVARLYK